MAATIARADEVMEMNRREFITLLGGAAAWPLSARAQQGDRVQALLLRILRLQAEAAAAKISHFLEVIESQVARTTQLRWSAGTLDQRRFDAMRLLPQAPAITEFSQLDPSGREQLRLSRLSTDIPTIDPKCIRASPLPAQAEQAEVGGLGIGVAMQGGLIKVVTPIDDKTPAAKAGILANDIIVALDDVPVQGLTLDQAVQKMRGPVNTKIKLTIARMGQVKPVEITIIRESIRMLATASRSTSIDPDVPGCPDQVDKSKEPKFSVAMAQGVYYGPVYFRRSEPYMTLSRRGTDRNTGVSVVEINLKFVWDVVSSLRVGEHGVGYMVDADGKLIAHPDLSLVLRDTDLKGLAQVRAARAAGSGTAGEFAMLTQDMHGRDVFAAYAPVAGVGWSILVELPAGEADAVAR